MKKLLLLLFVFIFYVGAIAQNKAQDGSAGYKFEDVKVVKHTSIKDQNRSGTCWSFSGLAFIESELIRNNKGINDLSEMFVVWHTYLDKAKKYVRMHGNLNFGGGGAFADVLYVIKKYGIVPEAAYTGLVDGATGHVHGELDELLLSYVKAITKNKNKKLTTAWIRGYQGVLNAYLGEMPEKFTFKGKEYTPKSYRDELGFNPDDYISLTSYSHHDLYKPFILEIPDNWLWAESYNLPLDEFMNVINNAIENDYTIAWGSDVSEKGFSWRKGVAVIPDLEVKEVAGMERDKWEKLSKREKMLRLQKLDKPVKEKEITQEMRQEASDNYRTTDDHGMEIVGIAKDQNGNRFYKIKNSWNTTNIYKGYFYASESFVKYKTMNYVVNKNAIPKNIRKKLGIK